MKVIGHIYEETNYDLFNRLLENRNVTASRVGKLVASISEKYVLNPIIVNEKMEIIDGQGRYEALKSLGLPIYYIVANGATSKDCVRMNKYNTKWSLGDFATSYAKAGRQAYICLLSTCKQTKLGISRVLRLANRYSVSSNNKESDMTPYERGELIFFEEERATVMRIDEKAREITQALQFTGQVNDAFYTAVKIMVETEGYNHDSMLRRCEKCRGTYAQMSSIKDQLLEFDRIYNTRRKAEGRLYFSDYMRNKGSNVRSYECNKRKVYDIKDVSTLK